MTTLTLNITDQSVMPLLLETLKNIKGVSIAPKFARARKPRAAATPAVEEKKTDGKEWARDVLMPIVQEVREASAKGYRYPDAHNLIKELEELDKQEL